MKANSIRELTDAELITKHKDLKEELFNLRFQLATGQLSNPKVIVGIKRDIARVKTIMRQREMEQKEAAKS